MQTAQPIRHLILAFCCLTSIFSCNPPSSPNQKSIYFPWNAFFKNEIARLQQQHPAVHKSILLNGKKEDKTLYQINFENELSLFLEADLNKPAFENSYDNLSENNLIWYSLKKEENLKVKTVQIQLDAQEQPENVSLVVEEKNFLFSSEKKMHLNFHNGQLQTYSIEGTQKLAWLNPTSFKLMGVILAK